MTKTNPAQSVSVPTTIMIQVKNLAVAPENPRYGETADEKVAALGQTILAAGNLDAILVREATKAEMPNGGYMILAGRRRYLGVIDQIEKGNATDQFSLKAEVMTDKKSQAAALLLTNTERMGMHSADVITAIGKMRKNRMNLKQISEAIGYDELEVKRLSALSDLPPSILKALKDDKIKLSVARQIARIKDKSALKEVEQIVADGEPLWEFFREYDRNSEKLPITDGRVSFVGLKNYRESGGRTESDLFGEYPEQIIDVPLLDQLWVDKATAIANLVATETMEVIVENSARHPTKYNDLVELSHWQSPKKINLPDRSEAIQSTREIIENNENGDVSIEKLAEYYSNLINLDRMTYQEDDIRKVILYQNYHSTFPQYKSFAVPMSHTDTNDDQIDRDYGARWKRTSDISTPEMNIQIAGKSHSLHERITDYGTRGLARALADDPVTALTVTIAQIFTSQLLQSWDKAASTIGAKNYATNKDGPTATLDGEIRDRLEAKVTAYKQSGLRPVAWVDSLDHADKMGLLAELTAMSLDLKETRTDLIQREARAQAAEIADMISYDITSYWTPDVTFLGAYSRTQLLEMYDQMGLDSTDPTVKALKKEGLIQVVAETAAELKWAPQSLTWSSSLQIRTDENDQKNTDDLPEDIGNSKAA
jgi:ParB family chromosome partitioning protein